MLLDAAELSAALVDNHVHKGIAHLLRRYLPQVFPLALAFVVAKLNFVGFDCAKKSIELEAGNLVSIDADFFAPFVEKANPVTEGSDFCYFAGHNVKTSNHRGHRASQGKTQRLS